MCLDVLRAAQREPAGVDALLAELERVRGSDVRLDRHADTLASVLREDTGEERNGRRIAAAIALGLAGATLVERAPHALADAFCASRLGEQSTGLGTLSAGVDFEAVIAAPFEAAAG
jgi:putative acyl-CoA dehydrogenase